MVLVQTLLPEARKRLVTVAHDAPLIEAAKHLRAANDLVVVCDPAGLLAGVITKTDVVHQISRCQGAARVTAASLVMMREVVTCRPGDWLHDVRSAMKSRKIKNVPITTGAAQPIGVLNAREALQGLLREVENEEALLRDYVMSVGYH